ncbi:MAG: ccmB [Ignavibacteria bacterium]|nr:ccmB [Ignavibacteria bacterium]
MITLKSSIAVFRKDLASEFRRRYAISSIVLFVLTSVSVIIFSTKGETLTEAMAAAILWVVMFFGSMTGLSKSFISEEERGTALLLQIAAPASSVYFGKLLFNIVLDISLNILAAFLFFLFFGFEFIKNFTIFFLTLTLGSLALASASTVISAIIAKARSKNALFPVLSFPLVLPIILIGVETTLASFQNAEFSFVAGSFRLLFAYSGVMITASYMLFGFIWKE